MTEAPEENKTAPETRRFDIFTVLAHDLKSPLNAVEANLDILEKRMLGDSIDGYLTLVGKSIRRLRQMRELIRDVVDWAEIQSGGPFGEEEVFDLGELLRGVVDSLGEAAKLRQVSVSMAVDGAMPFRGVPVELALLFRHLLENAIRYNRESGSVNLSLQKTDLHIVLEVADTGIGMTPDEAAKIFEEFVRIRKSGTAEGTGSGLGLSIAKRMIERYRGEIRVESEAAVGSRFIVKLPRPEGKIS
jgi:signal transduction histidine kinase